MVTRAAAQGGERAASTSDALQGVRGGGDKTRHNALLRRFITALTRGSAGAKPIEVHAHDPFRYASDMLSWVHQAVAGEKSFAPSSSDDAVVEVGGGEEDADKAFDPARDALQGVRRHLSSAQGSRRANSRQRERDRRERRDDGVQIGELVTGLSRRARNVLDVERPSRKPSES